MLADALITAKSLMRPWHEGQHRTSTAKVRAKSSAHRRYPPAGHVLSGWSVAAGGGTGGVIRALHWLPAASTPGHARSEPWAGVVAARWWPGGTAATTGPYPPPPSPMRRCTPSSEGCAPGRRADAPGAPARWVGARSTAAPHAPRASRSSAPARVAACNVKPSSETPERLVIGGRVAIQDVVADIRHEGSSRQLGPRIQLGPQPGVEDARQRANDQLTMGPVGSPVTKRCQDLDVRTPGVPRSRHHGLEAARQVAGTERNDTADVSRQRQP